MPTRKRRLDVLLVEQGLAPSREKAQALILAGQVRVEGRRVDKSGKTFPDGISLEVTGQDHPYVSRGGLKLEGALRDFGIDPAGWSALDVGASTGGFTHCLLLHGAARVYAVDVGYGQLAWVLRQDPRVVSLERTNIRHLTPEALGEAVDLVVIDASFISLKLIFPKIVEFLKPGGSVLALVKPQFEAGPEEVGRRGKVSSEQTHRRVLDALQADAAAQGFRVQGETGSALVGKKSGNQEFFLWLCR
jgi:23S rRNA (cytidine1920-2'-O)/16S rRNA (cytidine1409-2'-O)-methyltransferase